MSKAQQTQKQIRKAEKECKGQICKVCGEYKENEQFTTKGHRKQICKSCQSLPVSEHGDVKRVNDVVRINLRRRPTNKDLDRLERYAKKFPHKKSGKLAQSILDQMLLLKVYDCEEWNYQKYDYMVYDYEDCICDDCKYEDLNDLIAEYEFQKYMNLFLIENDNDLYTLQFLSH